MTMKKILYHLVQLLIFVLPSKKACFINNIRQKIHKRNIVYNYSEDTKIFSVHDKEVEFIVYFNQKYKGLTSYTYGIKHRLETLAETYGLGLINFKKEDLIIDCGAFLGEIYLWFKLNNLEVNYISFEASPEEYKCLTINCQDKKNFNIALADNSGFSDFYVKSNSTDSSLIEPAGGYTNKINVKTITLDQFCADNNVEKIKLFKLEAEGSEPEILNGSRKAIKKIEYVALDGGPERGKNKETTIEYCTNFLLDNNFEKIFYKVHPNGGYIRALFKNKLFY